MNRSLFVAPLTLVLAVACAAPTTDAEPTGSASSDLIAGRAGAVYTLSNDANENAVIVYRRANDGALQYAATHGTAGKGSGDGLGSQGALVLSGDRRYLFAVNAGSNELSVFRVNGESLFLVDTIATGGVRPVSVTEHHGLVYVVHSGDGANGITGFTQRQNGTLAALAGSTRALSAATTGPAQVQFSPSGRALLVTEKMTNKVDEFRINPYTGRPGALTAHASNGQTPFGFAVTNRGQVIVSEAFGGAADASAVSSYQLGGAQGLASVTASVGDTESAACWIALAKNDRYAYTSNTGSGTISAYTVGLDGSLALVDADGRSADTGVGSKPVDMAVSKNDRFLYVLESGTASLGVLRIENDGSLTVLPDVAGLPASAVGLAAQ